MMTKLPSRLFVAGALLAVALLSGCGTSSKNSVPTTEEIFFSFTAFRNHSTVWTSGYNSYGQLGDGTLNHRSGFLQVPTATGMTEIDAVAAGANHVVAYKGNTIWTWGSNFQGRLGIGGALPTAGGSAFAPRPQPITVAGPVRGVAAGWEHSVAIVEEEPTPVRYVYAWGGNASGQLGDGTLANSSTPVKVLTAPGTPLTGVSKVVAGGSHSLALTADGKVYSWGLNDQGQLGLVSPAVTNLAQPVDALPNRINQFLGIVPADQALPDGIGISDIAAAGSYSLALVGRNSSALDGTVWGWGYNAYGQLGPRINVPDAKTPALITKADGAALSPVVRISAGQAHVLAIVQNVDTRKNEVWAWGLNDKGQVGTGAASIFIPAPVKATVLDSIPGEIEDVYASGSQSFAKIGGKWYGWGDNGWGQLGQPVPSNSIAFLLTPTQIF